MVCDPCLEDAAGEESFSSWYNRVLVRSAVNEVEELLAQFRPNDWSLDKKSSSDGILECKHVGDKPERQGVHGRGPNGVDAVNDRQANVLRFIASQIG